MNDKNIQQVANWLPCMEILRHPAGYGESDNCDLEQLS
jgi:hypothetical protein